MEPADKPSGSVQDAAAAVTAQLNGPIGPCMPQPAASASALSGDDTTYEAGPQPPSTDSDGQPSANGMPCLVLFQPLVLVMDFNCREITSHRKTDCAFVCCFCVMHVMKAANPDATVTVRTGAVSHSYTPTATLQQCQ